MFYHQLVVTERAPIDSVRVSAKVVTQVLKGIRWGYLIWNRAVLARGTSGFPYRIFLQMGSIKFRDLEDSLICTY